jgi:hypothetical protein
LLPQADVSAPNDSLTAPDPFPFNRNTPSDIVTVRPVPSRVAAVVPLSNNNTGAAPPIVIAPVFPTEPAPVNFSVPSRTVTPGVNDGCATLTVVVPVPNLPNTPVNDNAVPDTTVSPAPTKFSATPPEIPPVKFSVAPANAPTAAVFAVIATAPLNVLFPDNETIPPA